MSDKVTRIENREGFWHLVTYLVSGDAVAKEISAVRTPWTSSNDPHVVAFTEEELAPLSDAWNEAALRKEKPIVFESKTRVNCGTGTDGNSEGEYIWPSGSQKKKQQLGKHEYDNPRGIPAGQHGRGCLFWYEIIYPRSTAADCPYHAKQYMKATTTVTQDDPQHGPRTVKFEVPAGDPAAQPNPIPGGFDAPAGWTFESEDKDRRNGKNASEKVPGTNGIEDGYIDLPGVVPSKGYRNPSAFDAKVRVEILDCNDKRVEWIEFEIHIAIDANGKVTNAELTKQSSGPK